MVSYLPLACTENIYFMSCGHVFAVNLTTKVNINSILMFYIVSRMSGGFHPENLNITDFLTFKVKKK